MKLKSSFAFILIFITLSAFADNGDTIVVRTIDWETPVLPGWNSPRSGIYQFPGDTVSFSKILMYYTLKCDPGQNPACGEWDYTTHTKILEHTGIYDSNLYYHPNYLVNNSSPDSFMFMNDSSYFYEALLEYYNYTEPTFSSPVGTGGLSIEFQQGNNYKDGKWQTIYTSGDLSTAGFESGDLTGIKINLTNGPLRFKHFTIRIQNTSLSMLPTDSLKLNGFETVFSRNVELTEGENELSFGFPFFWDGNSNVLVEFSWSGYFGDGEIEADEIDSILSVQSLKSDYFLDFEGWDYINVPGEAFADVDSAITISFWQYGNPAIQPAKSSIIKGVDSAGHRILNIHLPWSDGRIYWDAGWNSGYDRLDRTAEHDSDYEGKWNFWAFTKDVSSGIMRVYLNGELWNISGGNYRLMSGITQFRIGAAVNNSSYYAGMIDEFRVWNKELDGETIKEWMFREINDAHPDYDHLVLYYRFNDGGGFSVKDDSPYGFNGKQFGYPEWKNYRGINRFKNAGRVNKRPHLVLETGNYDPALLDSIVVVDTFAKPPVNIVLFNPDDPPSPMDTLTKWPSYYDNYVYDDNAHAIDSTLVAPDSIIYFEDLPYYGKPFEKINKWEIARYITPYGIGLDLGEGFTWVYDVTDYAPLLRDSVHITAGNFQELLDLKFYMIEGIPPRDVKKIEKIYSGYFKLNQFPQLVFPDTVPLLPEASTFKVKTRTSGHLFSNPSNCAEFCPKIHEVTVNSQTVYDWQILQECSDNPLYPQGGTWIYDRAGWCPGMEVTEHDIEITPYVTGDTVILDYNSQPDYYGAYVLEMQLFSYGEPNFILDAAVDDVIVPNNKKRYSRENPTASAPVIVISNRGADTLKKLTIEYGPGDTRKIFSWTGNLSFMDKEEIALEAFDRIEWEKGNGVFTVHVSEPNDAPDQNTINNNYKTNYDLPVLLPETFVIELKTNKAAKENKYELLTNTGEQVFVKDELDPVTVYTDTVTLLKGCYDFYLYDSGNNGISFWAEPQYGNGTLKFFDMDGNLIKLFNPDFGSYIHYGFCTISSSGTGETNTTGFTFDVVPNPNHGRFTLSYMMNEEETWHIKIYNTSGQEVWKGEINDNKQGNFILNHKLPAGIYVIRVKNKGNIISRKFIVTK
ncbi:MAG: T9SS type A sorting domain-containing protein [Chlorobi bacterium]|nr:T9SS type A sorting domain-containing protein [Chlorobiota bacterium]